MNKSKAGSKSSTCGRSTKRVCFSDYSLLRLVHPALYEDTQTLWYGKRDYKRFERDIVSSALALRGTTAASEIMNLAYYAAKGRNEPPNLTHTIEEVRGLEHLISKDVHDLLFAKRQSAKSRVIEEQAVQNELGENDGPHCAILQENI